MEERAVAGMAAMSLLESLLTELERKGILSETDVEKIYQGALAKAQAAQSEHASELLRRLVRAGQA